MEIPKHLFKFRYHILATVLIGFAAFSLIYLAPSLLTVLTFFWPLFLSTALVLAIAIVFSYTVPNNPNEAAPILKPAEELLHYVAGDHHNHLPDPPSAEDNKSD